MRGPGRAWNQMRRRISAGRRGKSGKVVGGVIRTVRGFRGGDGKGNMQRRVLEGWICGRSL